MEPIIEFLYTDDCKQVENSNDIDYICSLLIISDQLFIERLKEICEVCLSTLLTLKNCAPMLQFACTYNAKQLKCCVMEYVCLNLSAILESHTLEPLDDEVLNDLTEFYCSWNKNLSKRVITPFSDAPSDEIVKSVTDLCPVILKSDESDEENDVQGQKGSSEKKKKSRVRKNSENKNKFKDNENVVGNEQMVVVKEENVFKSAVKDEKWITILSERVTHEKIVKARLKAVAAAKEESNIISPETYTKLTKTPPKRINSKIASPVQSPSSKYSSVSPKFYPSISPGSSPLTYDIPIIKAPKISQKQRKKLAMDCNATAEALERASLKSNVVPNLDSPGPSPKNPWKIIEMPAPVVKNLEKNVADIIADEKKKKGNWTKMKTKPLIYTQVSQSSSYFINRWSHILQKLNKNNVT